MIDVRWFVGVVENVNDPQEGGRVQVRINNIHDASPETLPTKFLPWTRLSLPVNNACTVEGVGESPTGLVVGSHIFGISLDPMYSNLIGMFTWTTSTDETSSVHPLARGLDSELSKSISESLLTGMEFSNSNKLDEPPIDRTKTKYPNNDVRASRAGLETEIDNSEETVRVTNSHPSGAYDSLDKDGNYVVKRKSLISIILERSLEYVAGSKFVSVVGNYVRRIAGDNYVYTAKQDTRVANNTLLKSSEGLEILTPELRVSGDVRVGQVLYVSELRVGKIMADNISCSGVIDGVIKFSNEAVKAASVSPPVIPVPGSGAGDVSVTMTYEDNGGDYKFKVEEDEGE